MGHEGHDSHLLGWERVWFKSLSSQQYWWFNDLGMSWFRHSFRPCHPLPDIFPFLGTNVLYPLHIVSGFFRNHISLHPWK